ncbi:hypothetical protein CLOM_g17171 [Closterium sp. NIES-68]|nr:hypothetical protein CLOM_g17171 [Closterium sp. NIES-68]GJP63189.1 hypothetical protein CLOP_g20256 [Closterium sp. NIES-67]
MALVLICGQPCSGKSTVARQLVAALEAAINEQQNSSPSDRRLSVILLGEEQLHIGRDDGYQNMVAEKNVRGSLRSEVDRAVGKDRIVIVDSLNAIKGYRYELWCLARAAATKYCVVHCDVAAETAREWNERRREAGEPCYSPHVLDDLLGRFERPEGRNRWDSPLFEVHPASDQAAEEAEGMTGEVVALLVGGRGAASGQGRAGRALQPTVATQTATHSDANVLYVMDRATKEVVSAVMDAQASLGGATSAFTVDLGENNKIVLRRPIGLPELQRLRRTFVRLAGQAALSGNAPPKDASSAKRFFAEYMVREVT